MAQAPKSVSTKKQTVAKRKVATSPTPSSANEIEISDGTPIAEVSKDLQDTMLTSEVPSQSPAEVALVSGCGYMLKQEREAQGLTLEEVCKSLRLSSNQILTLENDDFAHLPHQSIVRGFIRNYTRLLKIDAAPILKAYEAIAPREAPLALNVKSTADNTAFVSGKRVASPKFIANLLFVLLLLFVMGYLYTNYIKPNVNTMNKKISLEGEGIQRNSTGTFAIPLPSHTNVATTNTSNQTEKSMQAAPDVMPENTAPSTTSSSVEHTITLKFSDSSWVSVEQTNGKKLLNELVPKDSERTVNAEPPVNINIGNALAVEMQVNNQSYDFSAYTKGNVARIQLN